MTKDERLQLNSLSKLLYGSSSKWKKLVNQPTIVDEEVTLEDGTKKKIRTTKYTSFEDVKKTMEELWVKEQEKQERQAKKELEELAIKQREMIKEKSGTTDPGVQSSSE